MRDVYEILRRLCRTNVTLGQSPRSRGGQPDVEGFSSKYNGDLY